MLAECQQPDTARPPCWREKASTAPSGEMIQDKDGPTIIVPKDEVLLPAEVLEVDT